jgi:hypothetical protein
VTTPTLHSTPLRLRTDRECAAMPRCTSPDLRFHGIRTSVAPRIPVTIHLMHRTQQHGPPYFLTTDANARMYASFVPLAMLSSEYGAWSVQGSAWMAECLEMFVQLEQ